MLLGRLLWPCEMFEMDLWDMNQVFSAGTGYRYWWVGPEGLKLRASLRVNLICAWRKFLELLLAFVVPLLVRDDSGGGVPPRTHVDREPADHPRR